MILFICYDANGFVEHVMIEKPAPAADINDVALRVSRQMPLGGAMYGACGRLAIKYLPSVTAKLGG
jgi:hypothetical protein